MTSGAPLSRPALLDGAALVAGVALALLATFAASTAQPEEPGAAAGGGAEAPRELTFGIVPQQSASRLARVWGPLAAHLGEAIGVPVSFATTKDIPTFEACLARGAFDIAYMNPYHYVAFSERSGYRALAHQADKKLEGIIVVRRDRARASLDDLAGARIAFPSPGAFGASVLPRAEMAARGIAFTPVYVRSHDSVYRAVARGLSDAGGGVARTFGAMSRTCAGNSRSSTPPPDTPPTRSRCCPGWATRWPTRWRRP